MNNAHLDDDIPPPGDDDAPAWCGAPTDALNSSITNAHDWPPRRALPSDAPSAPAFDELLLPDGFRPWLSDIAERIQCPVEYPTVGAMVAFGAVIGRAIAIRPKRQDDWTEVPNLWGAPEPG